MGYEDSVYLAKLAEQAERYEGMPIQAEHFCNAKQYIRNGREYEIGRLRGPRALR